MRKEEFCTRQISLCGILTRTADGARGASEELSHAGLGESEIRQLWGIIVPFGKSGSFVLSFFLSGSVDAHPAMSFPLSVTTFRLTMTVLLLFLLFLGSLVMTGRSWSHHTSTLDDPSPSSVSLVTSAQPTNDAFSGNRFGIGAQRHGVSECPGRPTERRTWASY